MSNLQPWQICTGLMCWPMLFIGAWVLYQAVTSDAVSTPHRRNVSSLPHVPNHAEMDLSRVAAALNENVIGNRGQALTGEVHVWETDAHEVQRFAGYIMDHGHDCENDVRVIRHSGSRPAGR